MSCSYWQYDLESQWYPLGTMVVFLPGYEDENLRISKLYGWAGTTGDNRASRIVLFMNFGQKVHVGSLRVFGYESFF